MSRFNSTSRRQVNKDLLKNFCEIYYPPSTDYQLGPCPTYTEAAFNILDRVDPVIYCDDVGACSPSYQLASTESLVYSDAPFCQVCTDVVQQFKALLEDPKFIDQLHRQVDAFCEYLTVIDADKQCRAALESYIDQALDFVKKVNPKDLCRSVQLCSASEPLVTLVSPTSENKQKVLPTLADFNDFGIETSVSVGGEQVKSLDESSVSGAQLAMKTPNCMFCKAFVKEMFKFLKENRTEENIRQALDQGCTLIYHDKEKRDHCEDLVKAYTKELLELLADETNPEVVCMLLDQCTYQTMLPSASRRATTTPAKKVESSILDSTMSYFDQIFKQATMNNQEEQPITMGQFISMLDSSIKVNSMKTCVECKLFIKYLQETMEEPSSQKEIKDWLLNNLCASLGDQSLASSCNKFVNQNAEIFFKAVVESLDPKKSCEELGACSARIRAQYITELQKRLDSYRELNPISSEPRRRPAATVAAKPLCDQCVQIVTKIDDYLSNHPIDHDISVLKDKVCNTIQDDNLRGQCVMIIQTFGQEIIQAISNMDSPNQLCQKITLC